MVVSREDKFGCLGDVCGSTRSLQMSQIPQNCVNAVCEGARDAKRFGIGAWTRHDRFLYIGLTLAVIALAIALVRKYTQSLRHGGVQPVQKFPVDMMPSSIMSEYVLIPKALARH